MLKIGREKSDRRENEVDPSLSLRENKKNSRKIILHGLRFYFYRGRQRNVPRIVMHVFRHCSRCSCGFLKLPNLPLNEVLSIVPDVFFDRLKGYFVDDQFVGETPLANLAGAEAPSEEDQSNK